MNTPSTTSSDVLDNIIIIQKNIRSVRSNFDVFLLHLNTLTFAPNVIILTETWIHDSEANLNTIPGYKSLVKCNNNTRSKGIIVFVEEDQICSDCTIDLNTADCLLFNIKLSFIEINVLSLYRYINFSVTTFVSDIEPILKSVKGNLIVAGDLNINILVSNGDSDSYSNLMCMYGFTGLFVEPTRITKSSSSTCIEHIFVRLVNSHKYTCISNVMHLAITYHSLTTVKISRKNLIISSGTNKQKNDHNLRIDQCKLKG